MKIWLISIAAVAVYITITLFTKRLLTWNLAMLYFVVTIDLIPRGIRRVLHRDEPLAVDG